MFTPAHRDFRAGRENSMTSPLTQPIDRALTARTISRCDRLSDLQADAGMIPSSPIRASSGLRQRANTRRMLRSRITATRIAGVSLWVKTFECGGHWRGAAAESPVRNVYLERLAPSCGGRR